MTRLAEQTALIIGVGGLGCPAALGLMRAGIGRLILADNDRVDESNLHRQILFSEADIGKDKLDCAREALRTEGPGSIELHRGRFLPEVAAELAAKADILIEGADNFPTKFLAADCGVLCGRPVVHGAAIARRGTAWLVQAEGSPCYRCLFEDLLPDADAPNCSSAGVLGPLVGVVGACMAELALRELRGEGHEVAGRIFSVDGRPGGAMRAQLVHPRADCPLCFQKRSSQKRSSQKRGSQQSSSQQKSITSLSRSRYVAPDPSLSTCNSTTIPPTQ